MSSDHRAFLKQVHERCIAGLGLMPVCGIELEFYIEGDNPSQMLTYLQQACYPDSPECPVEAIKAEVGLHQYEAEFGPTLELCELASVVERFCEMATDITERHGHRFICQSKPYPDRPACGMHVHINLVDVNHQNVFMRQAGEETLLLQYAIGGLLETLPAAMVFFAPEEACYLRYQMAEGTAHSETPTTVSWGGNNRTVAIRIPESSLREQTRRIEHRVPSVEASTFAVLAAVLAGVEYGIHHHIVPQTPKIYGHAFHEQYQPIWLPKSLLEAQGHTHSAFTG